jgi:hypothetical protein
MAHDNEEFQDEPPQKRKRDPSEPSNADEQEPPFSPERVDEWGPEKPRRRRRKRRRPPRSILKADEVVSPFTLQQGWLDGLFLGPNMILCLAVAFFCSPLMVWVAIFAAITAADSEARRNALVVIGICLLPVLFMMCLVCISKSINPG